MTQMDDTIVALRLDDGWQLARVTEGELHTLVRLPIPAGAVVRRDGEGRWWALVQQQAWDFAEDGNDVVVTQREQWSVAGFAWEGDSIRALGARRLPPGVIPKDVTADVRWLFVGGEKKCFEDDDGPVAFWSPVDASTMTVSGEWEYRTLECPMPDRCSALGKAVDALVVHDGVLDAVDDVVPPKYIYRYDLTGDAPTLVYVAFIPPSANEKTEPGAVVSSCWLVVRTQSVHRNGYRCAANLHRLEDLAVIAAYARSPAHPRLDWDVIDAFRWFAAAFIDDTLFLAAGNRGVCAVECGPIGALPSKSREVRFRTWDPSSNRPGPQRLRIEANWPVVGLSKRARWRLPSKGARVVDLVAVPSLRGAVVVEIFPDDARRARWCPLDAAG